MSTNRRRFLQSAAATIALPSFGSLLGSRALAQQEPARRFMAFFMPNGMVMDSFRPTAAGAGYELTRILQPLASVREHVSVISGIDNHAAEVKGVPGNHARGTGGFLTGQTILRGDGKLENGISVDQIIAQDVPVQTPLRSLPLGAEGGVSVGNCDSGYSCAYTRNISWAAADAPVPKLVDPRSVFDRLTQGADPTVTLNERARRRRLRQSVLDTVRADATSLSRNLGSTDRARLDEYLTGIRELERRVEFSSNRAACGELERPGEDPEFEERVDLMIELIAMAFTCDLTRVVTFMLGNAATNRSYEFLGVRGAHHEISHHQDDAGNLESLRVIQGWGVAQFGKLIEKLASLPDGTGTILDNTLLYLSSSISNSDRHTHTDLPILLAGGAGGNFTPGQHVVLPEVNSTGNLYMSFLQMFGVSRPSFGVEGMAAIPELIGGS